MIRETSSLSYMKDLLKEKKDDRKILDAFISSFDNNVFASNDAFPEIYAMTYRNDHPFLSEDYKGYLTLDVAMQWMPYNEYRGSKEELDKAIDQENFHCYQLHLYLYYSCKDERQLKMVKEWQRLSSSYKEKEAEGKEAFLAVMKETLDSYHKSGYAFLGYELDFTDSQ